MKGLIIDPEKVTEAFLDCLFKVDEISSDGKPCLDPIQVHGITVFIGFHPERLEQKRKIVKEWLEALPTEFRKSNGGGWSFLNACNQANGIQWTGLQQVMEQLMMLGIGLKMVSYPFPKELWSALPGGVPYFMIEI